MSMRRNTTLTFVRHLLFHFIAGIFLVLGANQVYAQTKAIYKSSADELVTIRSITLLPVFDNLQGIYARPVETQLSEALKTNHHFEQLPNDFLGPIPTPDELEQNAQQSQTIANSISSDAFISASMIKGPSGITMKMNLFLKADAKLLAQEVTSDIQRFDVESLKKIATANLNKLLRKVPYYGVVLSRQGTRVTMNLGQKDNVTENQVLSVIQIIKLNRHPKFNFLVSTEKEIVGKIKVLKVEDTLSFGRIVTEKEAGTIQVHAKIGYIDSVNYTNTDSYIENAEGVDSLSQKPDGKVAFGDSPTEWLPKKTPTFGMFGAMFSLGQFRENIETTGDDYETHTNLFPGVALEGELWLTPEWTMHANMRQGIVTVDNPVPGASPSELNRSLSSYELLFGYTFRLMNTVNAPKVELQFGYSTFRLTSDTDALSTKSFSGLKFGLGGSYPFANGSPYSMGANLHFNLRPKVSETGPSSGDPDNVSINTFGIFVDKQLSINLKFRGKLDLELYSSDFTGQATTSTSQKLTTVSGGLYYMF